MFLSLDTNMDLRPGGIQSSVKLKKVILDREGYSSDTKRDMA